MPVASSLASFIGPLLGGIVVEVVSGEVLLGVGIYAYGRLRVLMTKGKF